MATATPVTSLVIFLVKSGIKEADVLDDEALANYDQLDVRLGDKSVGTLYAKQTPITPPTWLKFFAGAVPKNPGLRRSSVSAVYLTRVAGRLFALAFGQGRHLLKVGSYEERFGLRVTLNSVDPDFLRAVDVSTLDANPFHGTRQTSREASLGEFGINLDQDILRAVTGRPVDEKLGRRMAGVDSLSVRVRVDLATLPTLLKRYLQRSEDEAYRERFRWVDHVAEVRDKSLEERLFRELVQIIDRNKGGVWGAIPERIDWTTFDVFRFGSAAKARSFDDITLDRMLECLDGESVSLGFWSVTLCMASQRTIPPGPQMVVPEMPHRGTQPGRRDVSAQFGQVVPRQHRFPLRRSIRILRFCYRTRVLHCPSGARSMRVPITPAWRARVTVT